MQRVFSFLVLLLATSTASATRIEHFFGTLTVEVTPIPAIAVTGEGYATLDTSQPPYVSLSVPDATLAGTAREILLTPVSSHYGPASTFNPIGEIQLSIANGAGALVDGAGAMPLRGIYRACLFGTCATDLARVEVPLTSQGRGLGIGGTFALPAPPGGPFAMTVVGAPWTTGGVTATTFHGGTVMRQGLVQAPGGGSGFESAAQHGGVIEMVSPFAIYLGDRYSTMRFGGVATFRAVFAPEPGTLVLLGAGVVGLALAGRSRQ